MCGVDPEILLNISGKSGCAEEVPAGIDGLPGVLIAGRDAAKVVEMDAGMVEDSTMSSKPSRG